MKPFALLFIALSTPALAHPGHLAGQEGHSHWVALAATGAALALAVIGIARGLSRRRRLKPRATDANG
jgi:hypothetical protein